MSNLGGSSGSGWADLWQDGAGGNYFRYVDCGLGNPLITVSIPGNVPYTITGTPTPVSGASIGTVDVAVSGTIAATQSGAWSTGRTWYLASGTDSVSATQSGAWTVSLGAGSAAIGTVAVTPPATWPLPTGAATSANQTTEIGYLSTIASTASGARAVTQSGTWTTGRTWTLASGTDTVSVAPPASWPLPTGAATAANQSTEIGYLATIASTASGARTVTGTVAATQSGAWSVAITGTAAISAVSLPLPTGAATSALQTTGNTSLATIAANTPALGPAGIAASVPVVTPLPATPLCGQKAIATTGTAIALGSGALTNGVVVIAQATNTGIIYVGASGVNTVSGGTGTGFPLSAGSGMSFAVANLSDLFINGTAADWVAYAGS